MRVDLDDLEAAANEIEYPDLSVAIHRAVTELREAREQAKRIAELEGERNRLLTQIECRDQRKMYVWTDHFSYLAVAHAKSVSSARELLLSNDNIGESGDGSCPERDKARIQVVSTTPCIWIGENAEFALTDSAELREQEAHSEKLQKTLDECRFEHTRLKSESLADGLPASWWMNTAKTQAAEFDAADKARAAEIERLTRERDESELILDRTNKYIADKLPLSGAHSVFENIDAAVAERDQLREQLAAANEKLELATLALAKREPETQTFTTSKGPTNG